MAEHQERDLETMVQAEKEKMARTVVEKATVELPVTQEEVMEEVAEHLIVVKLVARDEVKSKEVAEHLVAEKLVCMEEMKEVSEEEMKEVSEDEMKEACEEMMEENKVEMVANNRVKHTVWRPWEEEKVAEVRGLVDVGEKEKVAEHLTVKLVTHDGTQYPTP